MKKKILLIGTVLASTFSFGQSTPVSTTPANKNVILEEFTGIHCGYCPDGHSRANTLSVANPGRLVLVNIHAGGYAQPATGEPDLRTPAGTAIDAWMSPAGYPAGSVQRRYTSDSYAVSRGSWSGIVNTVLAEPSPVNVALDATIDMSTRVVTVNAEIYYTSPFAAGTNHYLNVGILQDDFEGPQSNYGSPTPYNASAVLPNGNYLHQHIFRGYVNTSGTWGDAIDASQTSVITKTYTYTLPNSIAGTYLDLSNLKFFAFVGSGYNTPSSANVYTAAEVTPSLTNIPNGYAYVNGITNSLNLGCSTSTNIAPVVKITNGGAPITSLTFSSSVNYGTPTITNWTGNIAQYGTQEITINNLPSFTVGSSNNVVVTVTGVNGGTGIISSSASATKSIKKSAISTGDVYTIEVLTDNYPSETSWELLNSSNVVVASAGPYVGNGTSSGGADALKTKSHSVTLTASDCYSFKLYDTYGDGLGEGSNPAGGFGFKIKKGNVTLYSNVATSIGVDVAEPSLGSKAKSSLTNGVLSLTYQSSAAIEEIENSDVISVFPNPASDKLNVSFKAENVDYTINISDLSGRVIMSNTYSKLTDNQSIELPLNGISSGNYIVSVSSINGTVNQHVAIK